MEVKSLIAALVLCSSLPALAQVPANDRFVNAQPISGASGNVTSSNFNATLELNEPGFGTRSVWFNWSAPFTGFVRFDASRSNFNSGLSVFTGPTIDALVQVDEGFGEDEIFFAVRKDVVYRIRVNGNGGRPQGAIVMSWAPANPPAPPQPNDRLAGAQAISGASGSVTGSNEGATLEPGENRLAPGFASVWYNWTAPFTGPVEFTTIGSNFDTRLASFSGNGFDDLVLLRENDDDGSLLSRITFVATAGTTYLIRVSGFSQSSQGAITLNWARATGPGEISFSMVRHQVNENAGSATLTVTRVPADGAVTVRYATKPDSATPGDDYVTTSGTLSFGNGVSTQAIVVPILNDAQQERDEVFLVELSTTTGGAVLVSPALAAVRIINDDFPVNDDFANAIALTGNSGTSPLISTIGATIEQGEPRIVEGILSEPSVWFNWTAPAAGIAVFDTGGSSFDTRLSIYTGNAVDALTLVAENNDDPLAADRTSRVLFATIAGATYRVRVAGDYGFRSGNALVNYTFDANKSIIELVELGRFDEVHENAGVVAIRLRRVGAIGTAETVQFDTLGISATENVDFTGLHTSFTLPPDQSELTVNIAILADAELEGEEGFAVQLSSPSANVLLGANTAERIVINDAQDDPANDHFAAAQPLSGTFGVVEGTAEGASREPNEPIHHSTGNRSVWYSYTAPGNGTATFRAHNAEFRSLLAVYTGATLASATKLGEDSDDSDDFAAVVSIPITAGSVYRIAVDDSDSVDGAGDSDDSDTSDSDDSNDIARNVGLPFSLDFFTTLPGTVQFSAASYSVNEAAGTATVTVNRTGGTDGQVTIRYATSDGIAEAGLDYAPASGELVIESGASSASFTVPIIEDESFEAPETVQLTLSSPGGGAFLGARSTATLTITSDDAFTPTARSYTAIFSADVFDAGAAGFLTLKMDRNGGFTGTLTRNGTTTRFKGNFDADGKATLTVGGAALTLQLGADGDTLLGTIMVGSATATISGGSNPFNAKTNGARQAGKYTVVLPGSGAAAGQPKGDSAATMTVLESGAVKIVGVLADGAKFSFGGALTGSGDLPIYAALYKNKGSLVGEVTFRLIPGTSHADGSLHWFRPAGITKPATHPSGFSFELPFRASRYDFVAGQRVIFGATGTGLATFGEGNLADVLTQAISVSSSNAISSVAPADVAVKAKVKTSTGLITGTFAASAGGKPTKFRAVVFQIQNNAAGSFLGGSESGFVRFAPAP